MASTVTEHGNVRIITQTVPQTGSVPTPTATVRVVDSASAASQFLLTHNKKIKNTLLNVIGVRPSRFVQLSPNSVKASPFLCVKQLRSSRPFKKDLLNWIISRITDFHFYVVMLETIRYTTFLLGVSYVEGEHGLILPLPIPEFYSSRTYYLDYYTYIFCIIPK